MIVVMFVIVLLVVGFDYNFFLVFWFKEEVGVGLKIGIIWVMVGIGVVVMLVGLVFVFIMVFMVVSEFCVIG